MRYNLGIIGSSAASLVVCVAIFTVFMGLWPALAQSAVPLRDRGAFTAMSAQSRIGAPGQPQGFAPAGGRAEESSSVRRATCP
jgi:hypothetical protein